MSAWSDWDIRYWNHPAIGQGGTVNDCLGNSHLVEVKARNQNEALNKAKAKTTGIFRVRSIVQRKNGIFACFPVPAEYK